MSSLCSRIDPRIYPTARAAFAVLALLGTSEAVPQQVALPGGPAQPQNITLPTTKPGQLIGELLELCETPQLDAMTHWFTTNFPDDAVSRGAPGGIAHDFVGRCSTDGVLLTEKVNKSEPSYVSLTVLGEKSNIWYTLALVTNSDGKITWTGIEPAIPAEGALPRTLSDAAIESHLRQAVAQLADEGRFSGLVVVARGHTMIANITAGYADRAKHTPFTGRTQFTLGSMGKMFTATGIGQLVDAHKLSFTDPVGRFFPDYPNRTVRDKVTVGMLLSHTGGLGDFLSKRTPEMMKSGVKRAAEFMPLYDQDEPRFEPGTSWSYSNAGLALAGAILEKVSGEDYPDYLRKHIFAPTGMMDSDPNNIPRPHANLVVPYTREAQAQDWHPAEADIGSPAGGSISTANDLVRFAEALRSGKLVSQATFQEMTSTHATIPGDGERYGYGVVIEEVYGRKVVGHSGGFPGVSTHLQMFLDAPYTIVALTNQDPPAESYAATKAIALVAERIKSERPK